MFPVMIV